jgi:hypothetical protein
MGLRKRIDASGALSHDRLPALLHRWKIAQYPESCEKLVSSRHVNYAEPG